MTFTTLAVRGVLSRGPPSAQELKFEQLPMPQLADGQLPALQTNGGMDALAALKRLEVECPPPSLLCGEAKRCVGAVPGAAWRMSKGVLAGMQGYWSACYGPHGMEIIHVRLCEAEEPGEAMCPHGASHRLVATKVCGQIRLGFPLNSGLFDF